MPKSKKQKTNHYSGHQPYTSRKNHQTTNDKNTALSHEEIWDDSALLRSWDDAVKEYEFYHSIHARGEDVDEVLRKAEEADRAEHPTPISTTNPNSNGQIDTLKDLQNNDRNTSSDEDGEIDEEGEIDEKYDDEKTNQHAGPEVVKEGNHEMHPATTSYGETKVSAVADTPAKTAIGADQTLENIKMAYYWAGYYSGLYDGQRQSQGQKQ